MVHLLTNDQLRDAYDAECDLVNDFTVALVHFYNDNAQRWKDALVDGPVDLLNHHDRVICLSTHTSTHIDAFETVDAFSADLCENFEVGTRRWHRSDLLARGLWRLRQVCSDWVKQHQALFESFTSENLQIIYDDYPYGDVADWTCSFWCEALLSRYSVTFVALANAYDTLS